MKNPKIFRNPRDARVDFLSQRKTATRTAADAQCAKWVAMNRDGIGTEINRATLACPLPPSVNVNTGRRNSQRGHKGS